MSVKISFKNLWVGDFNNQKSLEYYDKEFNSNIHGTLEIKIKNKLVPLKDL